MHDLDDAWFQSPACRAHPSLASELACARCGTFCCADCLDPRDRELCEPCAVVSTHGTRTREAYAVAWKLALGPALVVLATFSMLAHQRDVPPIFAVWLLPLGCAYAVARTERAGWAWLGAGSSLAVLLWLTASVAHAEQHSRLIDLVMLSIAPLVALPGCFRLSRVSERLRLSSSPTR